MMCNTRRIMNPASFVPPAATSEYGQQLLDMHGGTHDLMADGVEPLPRIVLPVHPTDKALYVSTNPGAVFTADYYDLAKGSFGKIARGPGGKLGTCIQRVDAGILVKVADDIFASQQICPSFYRVDGVGNIPATFWRIPDSELDKALNCAAEIFVSRLNVEPNREISDVASWRRDIIMQFHGAEQVAARVQAHCSNAELLSIRRSIFDEIVPMLVISSAVTVAEYTFFLAEHVERTYGYGTEIPPLPQGLHNRLTRTAKDHGNRHALDLALSTFYSIYLFGNITGDEKDEEEFRTEVGIDAAKFRKRLREAKIKRAIGTKGDANG